MVTRKKNNLQLFSDLTSQLDCHLIATLENDDKTNRTSCKHFIIYYKKTQFRSFVNDYRFLSHFKHRGNNVFNVSYLRIKKSEVLLDKTLEVKLNNF